MSPPKKGGFVVVVFREIAWFFYKIGNYANSHNPPFVAIPLVVLYQGLDLWNSGAKIITLEKLFFLSFFLLINCLE